MEGINLYTPPNRCYCHFKLGDKWIPYFEELEKSIGNEYTNIPMRTSVEKTNEITKHGLILDKLRVKRLCCRKTMLTFPRQ